jgi:hypothetical protein
LAVINPSQSTLLNLAGGTWRNDRGAYRPAAEQHSQESI